MSISQNSKITASEVLDTFITSDDSTTTTPLIRDADTLGGHSYQDIQVDIQQEAQEAKEDVYTQITNPNLLDNPWFTVNQRGETSYHGVTYTADRWKSRFSNLTVNVVTDGIILEVPEGSARRCVEQYLENHYADKILTASVMYSDGTIESKTSTSAGAMIGSSSERFYYKPSSGTFAIYSDPLENIQIKAVKLELGSVSTLAMDTAPNYQSELLKCQRYFVRWDIYSKALHNGFFTSSSKSFLFPAPFNMRSKCVVESYSGNIVIRTVAGYSTATGFTTSSGGDMSLLKSVSVSTGNALYCSLQFNDAATSVNNSPGSMIFYVGGHIDFSADL